MSKEIVEQRIKRLFELADLRISEDRAYSEHLADRYVELARNLGMKYNVSIPSNLRKRYCHKCLSYIKPGVNCQIRINSKNNTLNYHCKVCGEIDRYGF